MASDIPTKAWKWPDGQASSEVNALALNQLRRDRDELVAALETFLPYWRTELQNEGPGQVPLLLAEVERAEALLARVKAGR